MIMTMELIDHSMSSGECWRPLMSTKCFIKSRRFSQYMINKEIKWDDWHFCFIHIKAVLKPLFTMDSFIIK